MRSHRWGALYGGDDTVVDLSVRASTLKTVLLHAQMLQNPSKSLRRLFILRWRVKAEYRLACSRRLQRCDEFTRVETMSLGKFVELCQNCDTGIVRKHGYLHSSCAILCVRRITLCLLEQAEQRTEHIYSHRASPAIEWVFGSTR